MKKLTPAELWAVHSLEVVVFSACFAFIVTLYQAFQAGTFNLQSTGVAAASLLLAILGNGLKGMINNANFTQALQDVFEQVAHHQVSPVTIHNNIPAASVAPAQEVPLVAPQTPPVPVQQFVQPQVPFQYQPSSTYPLPTVQPQG